MSRYGEMMIAAGLLTQQQLDTALQVKRNKGGRLASIILELGLASERTLARMLSQQSGAPYIVMSQSVLTLDLLDLFPLETARKFSILPIRKAGANLVVAMADPHEQARLDEVSFVCGARIIEHGALMGPLHHAIEQAYRSRLNQKQKFFTGHDFDLSLLAGFTGHLELAVNQAALPTNATAKEKIRPESFLEEDTKRAILKLDLSPKSAEPAAKTSVLVVDDDESLRKMLIEFLSKSGYQAQGAEDGRVAIELIREGLPDLILLDAMLPGVHGFNLCRRLKNAEVSKHVPVIMISAVYKGKEHSEKARLNYGANAYLEKPLRLAQLKKIIENCMSFRESGPSFAELSEKVNNAVQDAFAAHQLGDLQIAADLLLEAIRLAPFFANMHIKLAEIYQDLGENYRTISQLELATELQQNDSLFFQLALAYARVGFNQKALTVLEKALGLSQSPEAENRIRSHIDLLKTAQDQ